MSDVNLSEDEEGFAANDVNDERESNVGGDLDQADKNETEAEIVYCPGLFKIVHKLSALCYLM